MNPTDAPINTSWAVERRLVTRDGKSSCTWRIGSVRKTWEGFRFTSHVASHKSSRKAHPTFEACLPRWTGYPDKCETRRITSGEELTQ